MHVQVEERTRAKEEPKVNYGDKVKARTVVRSLVIQKSVSHVQYRNSRVPGNLVMDFLHQNADKIQLFHFLFLGRSFNSIFEPTVVLLPYV